MHLSTHYKFAPSRILLLPLQKKRLAFAAKYVQRDRRNLQRIQLTTNPVNDVFLQYQSEGSKNEHKLVCVFPILCPRAIKNNWSASPPSLLVSTSYLKQSVIYFPFPFKPNALQSLIGNVISTGS